ncbi:hypothetical protein Hanom_Chr03g00231771 [Helianthus anomalus]
MSSEFSVPAFQDPEVGPMVHGGDEKVHGLVEELASGNVETHVVGGADQKSVEVIEMPTPREQVPVGGQDNVGGFKFAALSTSGPEANKEGPTLMDHWANLVGQVSPRPRKRPRCNDIGLSEEMFYKQGGPEAENITDNRDFNLNNSPRGSGAEQVTASVDLEDGEIGEGILESGGEPLHRNMEEEVQDTLDFGKIVGADLSKVRHLVEQSIRKEGINVVSR